MGVTDNPNDPALKKIGADGMQEKYLVLSEEERAKGFVRPVRASYTHVGRTVCGKPRRFEGNTSWHVCVCPPGHSDECSAWQVAKSEGHANAVHTANRLGGCGETTSMGNALAETYARNPSYYGATYCATCKTHLPVGADGEFVWAGTNERVGT